MIRIYEPDICVSMACGMERDKELKELAGFVRQLRKEGIDIQRYNYTLHRERFLEETLLGGYDFESKDSQPVTVADGKVVISGRYPDINDLRKLVDKAE
jgi:hypothetical protein